LVTNIAGKHTLPAPSPDPRREAIDMEITRKMTSYLLEHVNGDPDSMREEENGSRSFAMLVPLPEAH
jgi:hypothetical protein